MAEQSMDTTSSIEFKVSGTDAILDVSKAIESLSQKAKNATLQLASLSSLMQGLPDVSLDFDLANTETALSRLTMPEGLLEGIQAARKEFAESHGDINSTDDATTRLNHSVEILGALAQGANKSFSDIASTSQNIHMPAMAADSTSVDQAAQSFRSITNEIQGASEGIGGVAQGVNAAAESATSLTASAERTGTAFDGVKTNVDGVDTAISNADISTSRFLSNARGLNEAFESLTPRAGSMDESISSLETYATLLSDIVRAQGEGFGGGNAFDKASESIDSTNATFQELVGHIEVANQSFSELSDISKLIDEGGVVGLADAMDRLDSSLSVIKVLGGDAQLAATELREMGQASLEIKPPVATLQKFAQEAGDSAVYARALTRELNEMGDAFSANSNLSIGGVSTAGVTDFSGGLKSELSAVSNLMGDLNADVSHTASGFVSVAAGASDVANETHRANLSAAQFASTVNGLSNNFTDLHSDAKRLAEAVQMMETSSTFAAGFYRKNGNTTRSAEDMERVNAITEKLNGEFVELQAHVDGAAAAMEKLADTSALIRSEGIEGVARTADELSNHLGSIDRIQESVAGSRTELEGLADTTGVASGGAIQFAESQDRAANALDRASDSMANQRYALYDVAEAYRTVSNMAGKVVAATFGAAISAEAAFADVIRTVGLTGNEVEELSDRFVEMSTEIPVSFDELSEIASLGGQLGITSAGVEDFTEVVAKLGSTTDLTTESASFMIGRFQTILGTAPEEFESLASAVLRVGVNSVATESEISKTAIELAAFSRQAGLAEQDIIALSATLASGGIPAERARSAIEDTFTNIDEAIRENGEGLQRWARLAGVSVDEFASAWGTQDFMGMFAKSMEGLASAGANSNQVLDDLGIKSSRTGTTLLTLAASSDLLNQTLEDSHLGWAEASDLADQFGITADTATARFEMLQNAVTGFFKTVGDAFIGSAVFDAFATSLENITQMFSDFLKVPYAKELLAIVVTFSALVGAIAAVRTAQTLLHASVLALRSAGEQQAYTLRETAGYMKEIVTSSVNLSKANTRTAATTREATSASTAHTTALKAEATALTNVDAAQKGSVAATTAATAATTAVASSTTLTARAAAAASTTINGLTSMFKGLFTVIKSAAPVMAIYAAFSAIGWVWDKIRPKAEEVSESVLAINSAMENATKVYQETGEAIAIMGVAYDDLGNVARTSMVANSDRVDQEALMSEAADELASSYGSLADAIESSEGPNRVFGQLIDENTDKINTMILAMDEATIQEVLNALKGADDGGGLISRETELKLMDEYAQKTGIAALSLENLAGAALGNREAMDALNAAHAEELSKLESLREAQDLMEDGWEKGRVSYEAYVNASEATNDQEEKLRKIERALQIVGEAQADVNSVVEDFNFDGQLQEVAKAALGIETLGDSANDASDDMAELEMTALDAAMNMADAFYNLGQSLYENGIDFDIYSVNGRANLTALQDAVAAAVDNSSGNAVILGQNLSSMMSALVQNGMNAVEALRVVSQAYQNIESGNFWDSARGMASLVQSFYTTVATKAQPAINGFSRSLNQGYTDAMNKASKSSGKGSKGLKDVADKAKEAKKEVRTLSDYVSDLGKVMDRSFELRWGMTTSIDDTADAWKSLRDWAKEAQERIADARDEIQDAKDDIRDAKQEIKELAAEMSGLKADEATLEFQLKVAIDYGDTLRANDIRAELEENRAKQGEVRIKQQDASKDLSQGQRDLRDATRELAQANRDAVPDLNGATASAREQRDMVLDLLQSYQDQIQAYADTGASTEDLQRYSERLRGEFETQLRQLGYNQTEVKKYSGTFSDLTTVIKNVPRNITVKVNANPALTALAEFRAGLSKTNSSIDNTKSKTKGLHDQLGKVGGVNLAPTNTGLSTIRDAAQRAAEQVKTLKDRLKKLPTPGAGSKWNVTSNVLMATGGLVPNQPGASGFGFQPQGTDTVPAMLTPGEFVIKRSSVQSLGVPFLNALNELKGNIPASSSTYVHMSTPNVQLIELMPHQFNTLVSSVSNRVQGAMVSGADLSVATTRANQRAVRAGAN